MESKRMKKGGRNGEKERETWEEVEESGGQGEGEERSRGKARRLGFLKNPTRRRRKGAPNRAGDAKAILCLPRSLLANLGNNWFFDL